MFTMTPRVVIDTDVLVAALAGSGGDARWVFRGCLERRVQPVIGQALFLEYEAVFERTQPWRRSLLTPEERWSLLEDFLSVCEWTEIYYTWRPNLRDEGDKHVIELAVAGSVEAIVTRNVRDYRSPELKFAALRILTPRDFLKEYPCPP